jgi:hypothetical protein
MAPGAPAVALAALLGLLVAGCGGDPDGATSPENPTSPASSTSTDPAATLDQYLLQAHEIPGLEPILSPDINTGEPFALPRAGTKLLARSGYISTMYQPNEGDRIAGVSSVMLFDNEAGARDWMAYEVSDEAIEAQIPDAVIKRFEFPEIPGATGWTGPDLHGNAIGNIYWTQGRCMLLIAIETEGPRVEPLSVGASAIYERTGGTCPE